MNPPKSLGEINNVQSKDSASLREFVVFAHNLWACPLMVVACVLLLLYLLGWAGLVSCVLLVGLMPIERFVSKRAKAARKKVVVYSDKRMAIINELIDGIKTVKLTGLCPLVFEKVKALREAELSTAWLGMMIEMTNLVITRSGTLIITLVTFAVYSLFGSSISAGNAFSALAVINILGRPLQVLPKCVSLLTDALVSCQRIESIIFEGRKYDKTLMRFRLSDDADDEKEEALREDGQDKTVNDNIVAKGAVPASIKLENLSATRPPTNVAVLSGIALSLNQPGLIILVGENSSGKVSGKLEEGI